ncbi:hypothetical protein J132_10020 [Termitomyces sp. J132]|nr:hypothetical protein J132_10020 [Termitomyces sp. J132]
MWLKLYLRLGGDRPIWAYVADAIMVRSISRTEEKVDGRVMKNPLLQTWKMRILPAREACLDTMSLICMEREYNVCTEEIAVSRAVMQELPIWYHFVADQKLKRMNTGKVAECLRSNHRIRTVNEVESLSSCLKSGRHYKMDGYKCEECMEIENKTNCLHPQSCVERARAMIGTIPNKWNPVSDHPYDHPGKMESMLENRWNRSVANRVNLDIRMMEKWLGSKSIQMTLVRDTWQGTPFEKDIPSFLNGEPTKKKDSRVLVGIWL